MKRDTLRALAKGRDLVLVIVGLALSVAVFVASRNYPNFEWPDGGPPGFFPRLLAVVLALLCAALVVESLIRPREPTRGEPGAVARVALSFLGLIFAIFLFEWVGFRLTAVAIGLFVMALLFDWRSIDRKALLGMASTAVGAALLLHFLFNDIAGRRLPVGALFK